MHPLNTIQTVVHAHPELELRHKAPICMSLVAPRAFCVSTAAVAQMGSKEVGILMADPERHCHNVSELIARCTLVDICMHGISLNSI